MTFTREDLLTYEKQPQTDVADTQEHLMKGATPSKTATAAETAAANASAATSPETDDVIDPSGDDDGESGDPTVTGDGTSDVNADSSTVSADPSGEIDSVQGKTAESSADEAATTKQAPKKGSAAERIQELLDLNDGYRTFGQQMQEQLKVALSENARLKGGGTQAPTTSVEAPPATENDDPMPDMADPDINFDADKLRVKTQKWIKTQIAKGTQRVVKEITGQTAAERLEADVNTKVNKFAEAHPDWDAVVGKNPVLIANQLSQPASLAVAESPYTADILYKFGQNPGLAIKVAKMRPDLQLVKIGEITAQIVAEKAAEAATTTTQQQSTTQQKPVAGTKPAKQKSLTQAPPAHTPTKAAGSPAERDVLDPNMSMDEFARVHRQRKQTARSESRKTRGLS